MIPHGKIIQRIHHYQQLIQTFPVDDTTENYPQYVLMKLLTYYLQGKGGGNNIVTQHIFSLFLEHIEFCKKLIYQLKHFPETTDSIKTLNDYLTTLPLQHRTTYRLKKESDFFALMIAFFSYFQHDFLVYDDNGHHHDQHAGKFSTHYGIFRQEILGPTQRYLATIMQDCIKTITNSLMDCITKIYLTSISYENETEKNFWIARKNNMVHILNQIDISSQQWEHIIAAMLNNIHPFSIAGGYIFLGPTIGKILCELSIPVIHAKTIIASLISNLNTSHNIDVRVNSCVILRTYPIPVDELDGVVTALRERFHNAEEYSTVKEAIQTTLYEYLKNIALNDTTQPLVEKITTTLKNLPENVNASTIQNISVPKKVTAPDIQNYSAIYNVPSLNTFTAITSCLSALQLSKGKAQVQKQHIAAVINLRKIDISTKAAHHQIASVLIDLLTVKNEHLMREIWLTLDQRQMDIPHHKAHAFSSRVVEHLFVSSITTQNAIENIVSRLPHTQLTILFIHLNNYLQQPPRSSLETNLIQLESNHALLIALLLSTKKKLETNALLHSCSHTHSIPNEIAERFVLSSSSR